MAEEEVERPGGFKFQFIEVCGGLWGRRLGIAQTGPDERGRRRCLRSIDEQAVWHRQSSVYAVVDLHAGK